MENLALPNEVNSFPLEFIFFCKANQKSPAPSLVLQYFLVDPISLAPPPPPPSPYCNDTEWDRGSTVNSLFQINYSVKETVYSYFIQDCSVDYNLPTSPTYLKDIIHCKLRFSSKKYKGTFKK